MNKPKSGSANIIKPELGYHALYVGLDDHKEIIVVAIAKPGRSEPEYRGEIANKPKTLDKMLKRLTDETAGGILLVCYEAGPCGYDIYHQVVAMGHDCEVIAPSLIPKKACEKIKTDRHDPLKLARFLRSGDLTAVWVPDKAQEAMRDLTRARYRSKFGVVYRLVTQWLKSCSSWTFRVPVGASQ